MEKLSHPKRKELLLYILDKGRETILPLVMDQLTDPALKESYKTWKTAVEGMKDIKKYIAEHLPEDSRVNTEAFEQSLKENGLLRAYFPLVSIIDDTEVALKMMEELKPPRI